MLNRIHPIEIVNLIPKRVKTSHKGLCGRLLIIAGSSQYTGAASLMVEAALRTGVGIVYAVVTPPTAKVIRHRTPEAVVLEIESFKPSSKYNPIEKIASICSEFNINSLGIGPGLGKLADAPNFYLDVFHLIKSHQLKTCVDADALAPLYDICLNQKFKPNHMVFTPHPKEFLKMVKQQDLADVRESVRKAALDIAQTIVYKTHESCVFSPFGEAWTCPTGNESLATAGSGDVLAGMISGLMAQGVSVHDAAKLGVYLHGFTAELVSNKIGVHSLLARDLCDNIARGMKNMGN